MFGGRGGDVLTWEGCSLSLGSWNEGVGETGEESNVRTVYCEQVKLEADSPSFHTCSAVSGFPGFVLPNPALSL